MNGWSLAVFAASCLFCLVAGAFAVRETLRNGRAAEAEREGQP